MSERLWVSGLLVLVSTFALRGANLKEAQQSFLSGNYGECIAAAQQAVHDRESGEDWPLLLSQALLATGKYPEALTAITNALAQHRRNIRLSWQARQVLLANG